MKSFFEKYDKLPKQIKASFWFLVCSFMQKGVSAISTPIFTRLLSPEEYGRFDSLLSWQAILCVLFTLNLYYGVYTSGLVKFKEKKNEFISAFEGLTSLLVFSGLVLYLIVHIPFNAFAKATTFQMVCLIMQMWTTAIFCFWASEQRVEYNYKQLVIVTIIASILKPTVGIVLILNTSQRVSARIFGLFIVELLCYGWMFIAQVRKCPKLYSKFFWKYALRFSIPLVPHYMALNVLSGSDKIMIQHMISDEKAGIYSLAVSVSLIMNLFSTALTQTTGPWAYEKIKTRNEKDIAQIIHLGAIFIAAVNLALIVFAPEAVRIFAPPKYAEAIWTVPPVAMGVYFYFLYNVFSFYEFYFEKTHYIAIASTASALLNIVLNYIFIGIFGYIAAAFTTLICYAFYAAFHYVVMAKVADEYLDGNRLASLKTISIISIVFMLVGFGISGLYNYPVLRYSLIVIVMILGIVYRKKVRVYVDKLLQLRKNDNT